jgi:hypothetical protein
MPIIPALIRQGQEDLEFEDSLAMWQDSVSKKKKKRKKEKISLV